VFLTTGSGNEMATAASHAALCMVKAPKICAHVQYKFNNRGLLATAVLS
jgi:acetylornithine/succinyldiaminopimelate/putrescine aminotransferase